MVQHVLPLWVLNFSLKRKAMISLKYFKLYVHNIILKTIVLLLNMSSWIKNLVQGAYFYNSSIPLETFNT